MGLGTNRDYKKTHEITRKKLKLHNMRMDEFEEMGFSRDFASKLAYSEILLGKIKLSKDEKKVINLHKKV